MRDGEGCREPEDQGCPPPGKGDRPVGAANQKCLDLIRDNEEQASPDFCRTYQARNRLSRKEL